MPRRMRGPSNTPSTSLPRERSLPRKEPSSRSCAPALPPDYSLGSPRPAFSPPTTLQMGEPEAARQAFCFSSSESSLTLRSGWGEHPQKPQEAGPDRSNISARLQHDLLTQVCHIHSHGFDVQKESINISICRVIGDTTSSLLQRTGPTSAIFQSSASLSIILNKDANGFPSW